MCGDPLADEDLVAGLQLRDQGLIDLAFGAVGETRVVRVSDRHD